MRIETVEPLAIKLRELAPEGLLSAQVNDLPLLHRAADKMDELRSLLSSCRRAMEIAQGEDFTDWRYMIAAIDKALGS